MGVMRNDFTESMRDDLYGVFWENYPTVPSKWEELFETVSSDSAYEQFTSAVGLGKLLEKPEGEDLQADLPMESYTVVTKNRTFGRLVQFSYESTQDAKKGSLMANSVASWSRQVPNTKEEFYAKFFNNGALTAGHDVFNNTITGVISDATGDLAYDSKVFFDTDHPDKVSNTYANFSASNTLTADHLKTTYLTYTNTNNRDERGDIFDLEPDVLLIPKGLRFTAQEILNTVLIPSSMDNTINVLNTIVAPLEWAYLTDSDSWFLGKKKMGLMATDRETVNIDVFRDDKNLDYYVKIFCRFGGNVTNWRYWYGNNLSTTA